MLMVPAGATIAGAASVAWGTAVGESPEEGTAVADPDDAVVGVESLPPVVGAGVAVAEDPQATKRAATNRTKT
jgi:hypothetical protein